MKIRIATVDDAEKIREIYAPYVLNTAVSFEYELPSTDEFGNRISNTLKNYPYLVAENDGIIVGYAYASPFGSRKAYLHSAELSVYVGGNYKRNGIGKSLYLKIEDFLRLQNVFTVHACIAHTDEKDDRLTNDSEKFHESMGFKVAGKHDKCGYKFGKWYDVIRMEKDIQEKNSDPKEFVPFSRLLNS